MRRTARSTGLIDMETILLMFSGGVDSTYLLHHYLAHTDHPLHVHHISLRYPHLQRWRMEDPAVRSILGYCRERYRDFDYSESRFDLDAFNLIGWDSDLQLLVASKVGPNLPGDGVTVALGQCLGDLESPEVQERFRRQTMSKLWLALRESVLKGEKLNPDLARPLIDLGLTKADIFQKMPADLLRLCWSCRKPDFAGEVGSPCGYCQACQKNERALSQLGRLGDFPNLIGKRGKVEINTARNNGHLRQMNSRSTSPEGRVRERRAACPLCWRVDIDDWFLCHDTADTQRNYL